MGNSLVLYGLVLLACFALWVIGRGVRAFLNWFFNAKEWM